MFCSVWWISHRFGKTLFFVFTLSFEGNARANVLKQYHMAISTWCESSHRIYSSILTKLHWYQWVKSLYKYWIFIWIWAHLIVALWVPSYIPNGVHWIDSHSNGSSEVKIIMIVSIESVRWQSNSIDGNQIRAIIWEFFFRLQLIENANYLFTEFRNIQSIDYDTIFTSLVANRPNCTKK